MKPLTYLLLIQFISLQFNAPAANNTSIETELLSIRYETNCFEANANDSTFYEFILTVSGGVPPYYVYLNIETFFEIPNSDEPYSFLATIGEEFSLFVKDSDTIPNELYIPKIDILSCGSLCEDLSLEVDIECQDDGTKVLHFEVEGANGEYSVYGNQNGDTLQIGDTYWIEVVDEQGCTKTKNGAYSATLQPKNDWAGTTNVAPMTIDVLSNDEGDCLTLSGILVSPTCGEIVAVDPITGIITYQVEIGSHCTEDSFVYEVVDAHGNTAQAKVFISLPQQDLVVEIDRDCWAASEYLNYIVTLEIVRGHPPFTIFGSINATLEELGSISVEIENGYPYDILVTDALGNEFYVSEYLNCHSDCPVVNSYRYSNWADCTCEENLILHFDDLFAEGEEVTHIDGIWNYQNEYGYLSVGDTIPANAHIMIFRISTNLNCYTFDDYQGLLSGFARYFCPYYLYGFDTQDDYVSAVKGFPILIDVFENDGGEELKITNLHGTLQCGEIIDYDPETGIIQYLPNTDSSVDCKSDDFSCRIEDVCGDVNYSDVFIDIEEYRELRVKVEKDCADYDQGFYTITVSIVEGQAPFIIMGSINETLEQTGSIFALHSEDTAYEIRVEDALGNVFFEEGDNNPCHPNCQSLYMEEVNDMAQCICSGEMAFILQNLPSEEELISIEGNWHTDNSNGEIALGDTIPNEAFFEIHRLFTANHCYIPKQFDGSNWVGKVNDFCVKDSQLQTANDVVNRNSNNLDPISIPVLQNDSGQNLQITQIAEYPFCGDPIIIAEEGIISYQPYIGVLCAEDSFEYEVTDECGNTATALVTIRLQTNDNILSVETHTDCTNVVELGYYALFINIIDGVKPFHISGSVNLTMEEKGLIETHIEAGNPYEITITDNIGRTFETWGKYPCMQEELCATLQILPSYDCFLDGISQDTLAVLTYEATGGDGNYTLNGNLQYDILQNGGIYQIEVIDGNGCTASIVDTVNCFFTSIENPNIHTSIPNIHLFPNPNKGNFTLSLESKQAEEINIEIYDVVGRVKTRRHLQGSATFEREDFNLNLESGLYFIRLSGKDWTWTEKMVVE